MESDPKLIKVLGAAVRFEGHETERNYREWRVNATLSYMQLGWLVAAGTFAVGGVTVRIWVPAELAVFLICVGIVPLFIFAIWLTRMPSIKRFYQYLAVALNWLGGGTAMLVGGLISLPGMVIGALIASLYIPFMRHSPGAALLGSAPLNGVAAALVVAGYNNAEIGIAEAWLYVIVAMTGLFTVWIVALVHESLTRDAFSKQRIIHTQRQLLDRSNKLIRRYVPSGVAEQILSGNEQLVVKPRRCRVTILFADLVGFTEVADQVDPETLTEIVQGYMSTTSDMIEEYGGTLNEFAGDGIMALFGAPQSMEPCTQVFSALKAAQAMQDAMPGLNLQWRKAGLTRELALRIGVNTGTVSVGSFGSDGRMTYTGIGLQTNIAARIQAHCEPGHILISDASWQLIADQQRCTAKGDIECKGVHFRIGVYEPEPLATDTEQIAAGDV